MVDDGPMQVEALQSGEHDEPESVVIHANPVSAIIRAAGSPTSLALASLIVATLTILTMSVANDIADAKLYSSRGFDNVEAIHWVAATRLIIAGVAVILALVAGIRHSRTLPATRYTFSDDGDEAAESIEGAAAPHWVSMLIGSSFVVCLLAIVLNGVALLFTLHLHESPNFGIPGG